MADVLFELLDELQEGLRKEGPSKEEHIVIIVIQRKCVTADDGNLIVQVAPFGGNRSSLIADLDAGDMAWCFDLYEIREYEGKQMIVKIYELEGREKKEPPDVRLKYRQENVKPLVDQYFKWCQEHQGEPLKDSETDKAINYSLNQEAYLKVFLVDGEVPIDNSASERAIKAIALGRKNWMIIDTIHGAEDTAICYSIVETAKANGLNPEKYFAKLLTTIPEHMDDKYTSFLDELLPWSDGIQATCRTDM